jgi:hypothetical protein
VSRILYARPFPGQPLKGVRGTLTLAATDDGLVTVGHSLHCLTTMDLLALGCSHPLHAQDVPGEARNVLTELWMAQETLLDLPPFI